MTEAHWPDLRGENVWCPGRKGGCDWMVETQSLSSSVKMKLLSSQKDLNPIE